MWSISCTFRSNGRSTMSSTQHSSPHIRKQRNTDQTTTSHPQTSSKANQSGKWSKLWEQDALDVPDGSNIKSGGQDTPTCMTLGPSVMHVGVSCPTDLILAPSGSS